MTGSGIGILGTGSYLPERELTNAEMAARVPGADAEWIERRTHIVARRVAASDQAASDLAVHAARAALDDAGLAEDDVQYVIVSTTTGDAPIPSTASLVQHALGAYPAGCFDVNIACAGYVTALSLAHALVAVRPGSRALVIGVDVYTRFVDYEDRATSVLFGDGAGAAVVGAVPVGTGFLGFDLEGRGDAAHLIGLEAGGSRRPASAHTVADGGHLLRMKGREVRHFVLGTVPGVLDGLLKRRDLSVTDVDHFVPHQPNGALLAELVEAAGLDAAETHVTLGHTGNIGSASVAVALDEARRSGTLMAGQLVLLAGFGAGMAVGAGLVRWSGRGGQR